MQVAKKTACISCNRFIQHLKNPKKQQKQTQNNKTNIFKKRTKQNKNLEKYQSHKKQRNQIQIIMRLSENVNVCVFVALLYDLTIYFIIQKSKKIKYNNQS